MLTAALLGVLTATVVEFHKLSPDAAYLLLPYLGWSTFAAVLTLDIWRRNPEVPLTTHTSSVAVMPDECSTLTWPRPTALIPEAYVNSWLLSPFVAHPLQAPWQTCMPMLIA